MAIQNLAGHGAIRAIARMPEIDLYIKKVHGEFRALTPKEDLIITQEVNAQMRVIRRNWPVDTGTSRAGWKWRMMNPGEDGFDRGVEILNDAKAKVGPEKGEMYASDVRRRKGAEREWLIVFDRIEDEVLPEKVRELRKRIIQNIGRERKRVKLRAMSGTLTQNFDILSGTTTL